MNERDDGDVVERRWAGIQVVRSLLTVRLQALYDLAHLHEGGWTLTPVR